MIKHLLVPMLLMAVAATTHAQSDTINIDLGNPGITSAAPWNNLTDHDQGMIPNLLNSQGLTTGISVAVTDSFNGDNTAGGNADPALRIPNSGSNDSFFGSAVPAVEGHQVTGGITLYGLDPAKSYDFGLFASRTASDNRETQYFVEGSNIDSASLNVSSNTSTMVSINNISPKPDSSIVITATTGANNNNSSGYYYLGVVRMVYTGSGTTGPKSLELVYPNGGELWEEGAEPHISWNSVNVLSLDIEYSTDNGATWSPVASGVSALSGEYDWTIPSDFSVNSLVRIVDASDAAVADTSDATFTIMAADPEDYTIVVLGSSTAAGTGPSSLDSAWVWRYREYLTQKDTRFSVINLAVGGFTTYNILPTGTPISGVGQTVRVNNNVSKAVTYVPDAIIINLPSNDATNGYPVSDQLDNYDLIVNTAEQGGASVWVTTPQPRNLSDPAKIQIQEDMVDSTFSIFGNFAIDFWSGFNTPTGTLKPEFDSGDGIHVNDDAHKIFFERVIGKDIYNYVLANPNPNPDSTVSIKELKEISGISIYPNPADDVLNLKWEDSRGNALKHLKLVSTSGDTVLSHDLASGEREEKIDVSGLPGGFYLVIIETESNSMVSRILIR